jgi:hypothetical protein
MRTDLRRSGKGGGPGASIKWKQNPQILLRLCFITSQKKVLYFFLKGSDDGV